MSAVYFPCTACRKTISADRSGLGFTILCPHCRRTIDVPWETIGREREPDPPPVQSKLTPTAPVNRAAQHFDDPWVVKALAVMSALCFAGGILAAIASVATGTVAGVALALPLIGFWTLSVTIPLGIVSAIVHYLAYSAWISERTHDLVAEMLRRDAERNQ